MRVALDARMAAHSGIGRHLRCLTAALAALSQEEVGDLIVDLFLNPGQDAAWVPESPRLKVKRLPREVPVYSWREWTLWPALLRGGGYDLVHVPHFNIPWRAPVPLVVTLHDAIYWRFPEATGSSLGGGYARAMLKRSVRVAARLIAVSKATAEDLAGLIKVDPGRLEVIPNGAPAFRERGGAARALGLRSTWNAPDGYLLYVGNFLPHKGLDVLLMAMGALETQGRRMPLVLVGREDARGRALRHSPEAQRLGDRIVFAGYLGDEALAAAYAGARLLVSPSPWEGFGFPALEALAAGVPVVAVAGGASPEVLGEGALYARPGDAVDLAEALLRAWTDEPLRGRLVAAGRERLKAFSWEEAARRTVGVYRKVAGT